MSKAFKIAITVWIIICIILILVLIMGLTFDAKNKPTITYDSVNLHIQYKGCVVADKLEKDGTYKLVITNRYWPLKDQYKEITVNQNIYTNLYFIGDTIK